MANLVVGKQQQQVEEGAQVRGECHSVHVAAGATLNAPSWLAAVVNDAPQGQ